MAKLKPENTLRFAWWGAEELGLIGSTDYVNGLSPAERDRIALYLNYDMVGSPNYLFMVYDADQSTGAEQVKTPEQQAIWGGTAGQQFDPCYHQVCDTFDNVDLHALEVNSDLIAFAQLTYAYSTESVNGVVGKKVPGPAFNLPPPAGPEGTFGSSGGGGSHGPGPQES